MAPLGIELRSLRESLADAHHDAAVDLPVGADLVEDRAAVVRGSDLQHTHDARAAIDLDPHRVRHQLRRMERLEAEPPDASLGGSFGGSRELAGALTVEGATRGEVGDRHRLVG